MRNKTGINTCIKPKNGQIYLFLKTSCYTLVNGVVVIDFCYLRKWLTQIIVCGGIF